ncbi:hypothetical protein Peur_037386 [Populus x canadensis]
MSQPKKNNTKRSAGWFKKFQYDEVRDSPSDARNVLLVVVALIAAVTFQAGVNPPGGVWQEGDRVGRAIYASQKRAFYVFLISNTLALSTSSMMITYASAVFAVTPNESVRFRYLLIAASVPFVMRCFGYFFKKYCMSENESQIGGQEEVEKRDGQAVVAALLLLSALVDLQSFIK